MIGNYTEIMFWIVGVLVSVLGSCVTVIIWQYTTQRKRSWKHIETNQEEFSKDLKVISKEQTKSASLLVQAATRLEQVEKVQEQHGKRLSEAEKHVGQAFSEVRELKGRIAK